MPFGAGLIGGKFRLHFPMQQVDMYSVLVQINPDATQTPVLRRLYFATQPSVRTIVDKLVQDSVLQTARVNVYLNGSQRLSGNEAVPPNSILTVTFDGAQG
jgi:hypothetical protein